MVASNGEVISEVGLLYLRLKGADGIGPVCAKNLVEHFGAIEKVFGASLAELERVEDVGQKRAAAVVAARNGDGGAREVALAARSGVRIVCLEDESYPALLRHIPDPPICLYVRGDLRREDGVSVAIVGSRRCSRYGIEQAERFGASLGHADFTVISGMARGADGAAHYGAMSAGGRTLAVLGCGLNHIYPSEHAELADRIAASGAVISELPMDTPPDAAHFPPRNRIVVGMSMGVIVIEAGKRSGALISARLANEYNREVFALPGLITNPYAHGTNALIRDGGAKLISCLDDVLDELGAAGELMRPETGAGMDETARVPVASQVDAGLDEVERAVLGAIGADETSLENILRASGVAPQMVASSLTKLQMKGFVAQFPGNLFIRKRGLGGQ